jgi:hypothetical protein
VWNVRAVSVAPALKEALTRIKRRKIGEVKKRSELRERKSGIAPVVAIGRRS